MTVCYALALTWVERLRRPAYLGRRGVPPSFPLVPRGYDRPDRVAQLALLRRADDGLDRPTLPSRATSRLLTRQASTSLSCRHARQDRQGPFQQPDRGSPAVGVRAARGAQGSGLKLPPTFDVCAENLQQNVAHPHV